MHQFQKIWLPGRFAMVAIFLFLVGYPPETNAQEFPAYVASLFERDANMLRKILKPNSIENLNCRKYDVESVFLAMLAANRKECGDNVNKLSEYAIFVGEILKSKCGDFLNGPLPEEEMRRACKKLVDDQIRSRIRDTYWEARKTFDKMDRLVESCRIKNIKEVRYC